MRTMTKCPAVLSGKQSEPIRGITVWKTGRDLAMEQP